KCNSNKTNRRPSMNSIGKQNTEATQYPTANAIWSIATYMPRKTSRFALQIFAGLRSIFGSIGTSLCFWRTAEPQEKVSCQKGAIAEPQEKVSCQKGEKVEECLNYYLPLPGSEAEATQIKNNWR
ncbi:MAG: hypothetical protein AAGF04_05050, partial [Chlamydiota bacterium]